MTRFAGMMRGLLPAGERRDYASVTASQVVQLGSSFGLTMVLARELGPASFGSFAFFIACVGLLGTFAELGVFSAAARLLARESEPESSAARRLIGAAAVLAGGIFLAFDALIGALSFVVDPIFDMGTGTPMLVAAPIAGGVALDLAVLFLCQGTGRFRMLVAYNLIARPVPLLAVVALAATGSLNITLACILYAAGPTIAAALVLRGLRPDFSDVQESLRRIMHERKRSNDFGLYFGRALGTSTYNMDRLLVAFFLTPADLSYYALAFSLTMPIVFGSQSLVSVSYKLLVASRAIPRRLFVLNAAWLAAAAAGAAAAVVTLINTLLEQYEPILEILVPVLLTSVIAGAIQLPNWFLMAQGKGKMLRDIALVFTGVNLALNFTLIPSFGLMGAACASFAAATVSLVLNALRYRSVRGAGSEASLAPTGKATPVRH